MQPSKIIARQLLGESHGISAEIVTHQAWEVPANVLILHLPQAVNALSAYQGFRKITIVCNCQHPPELWQSVDSHTHSWKSYSRKVLGSVLKALNLPLGKTAVMSTGVDMHHLACVEETYEELWVQAWVTAGVKTNALRIGRDAATGIERNGIFQPMGTINTIVLTSASLDQAALAASFITITEAKVVALQELDIRSSYNQERQATGTSTDQIVVVSGSGDRCFYVSGHAKLGELMARAVTKAVIKAIKRGLGAQIRGQGSPSQ